MQNLVDVSDILDFFCSGRGKGESEVPGGRGNRFFIENSRTGGGSPGREGPRGREGPGGCLRRIEEFGGG